MLSPTRRGRVAYAADSLIASATRRLRSRMGPLAWKLAPGVMAERAHRHQKRLHAASGHLAAAERFVEIFGSQVRRGPFTEMTYGPERMLSLQKLLGTYEYELHAWIEFALARNPQIFVDIGASDGYYAVGVARRGVRIEAFESGRTARREIAELARANGVSVNLHATATGARVRALELDGAFVLSDCEGAEDDIFDQVTVDAMRTATAIIEVHETMRPGAERRLRRRFEATHHCERAIPADRDPRHYSELERLDERDRLHVASELRHGQTPWLLLTPKAGARRPPDAA